MEIIERNISEHTDKKRLVGRINRDGVTKTKSFYYANYESKAKTLEAALVWKQDATRNLKPGKLRMDRKVAKIADGRWRCRIKSKPYYLAGDFSKEDAEIYFEGIVKRIYGKKRVEKKCQQKRK